MISGKIPISIYNADTQELVGVFKMPNIAARYLSNGRYNIKESSKISSAAKRAGRLKDKPLGYTVAVRFATPKDIELLGEEDYVFTDNYKGSKVQMNIFLTKNEF